MFVATIDSKTGEVCERKKEGYFLSVPKGTILAYAGSRAPEGYELCDGNNGTPDMRNCVPVHTNSALDPFKQMNQVVGSDTHVLTVEELPIHSHKVFWTDNREDKFGKKTLHDNKFNVLLPEEKGTMSKGLSTDEEERGWAIGGENFEDKNNVKIHANTMTTGSSEPHENRQPFTYVNFIMKL